MCFFFHCILKNVPVVSIFVSFFLFSLIFAINFLFSVHHCPKQEGEDANSHDTHQREHDVGYLFATVSCAHG